jgi:hypothetical protein
VVGVGIFEDRHEIAGIRPPPRSLPVCPVKELTMDPCEQTSSLVVERWKPT